MFTHKAHHVSKVVSGRPVGLLFAQRFMYYKISHENSKGDEHYKQFKKLCILNNYSESLRMYKSHRQEIGAIDQITYTKFMSILVANKSNLVVNVLKEIEETHGKCTGQQYSIAIKSLLEDGKMKEGKILAYEALNKKIDIYGSEWSKIMKTFLESDDLSTPINLFEKMIETGTSVDTFLFTTIMGIYLRKQQSVLAKKIYDVISSTQVKMDLHAWTVVTRMHIMNGDVDEAFLCINRMIASGCKPDKFIYTMMISALSKKEKYKEATQIFELLKEAGGKMHIEQWTIIIKMHIMNGDIEAALSCIGDMIASGCDLDKVSYVVLISTLVDKKKFKEANQIYDIMIKSRVKMNIELWNTIMKMHVANKNVDLALSCLDEMSSDGIKPDDITYAIIMGALINTNRINEANKLLQVFKNDSTKSIRAWNTIISMHCANHDFEAALSTVQEMKRQNCSPDNITFTILLNSSISNKEFKKADEVYELLKQSYLNINTELWTVIIRYHIIRGQYDYVFKCFQKMTSTSRKPDGITYVTAINELVKAKQFKDAYLVYVLLIQNIHVKWDQYIHNSIINMYAKNNDIATMNAYMKTMRPKGFEPDNATYTILLSAFVDSNQLQQATKVYEVLKKSRSALSVEVCNAIIKMHIATGDIDSSFTMLNEMLRSDDPPNSVTYIVMINELIEAKHFKRALQAHDMLIPLIDVNEQVSTVRIKMFIANDEYESAFMSLCEAHTSEGRLDNMTYAVAINEFVNVKQFDKSHQVYTMMKNSDIEIDIKTWNCIIKMHIMRDDAPSAFLCLKEMTSKGCKPDNITYVTMLSNFIAMDLQDEAAKVYRMLLDSGISFSIETWCTIIKMYASRMTDISINFDRAVEVHDQMIMKGVEPNAVVYCVLLGVAKDEKKFKTITKRIKESNKAIYNTALCNTLISAHIKFDQPDEAYRVYQDMITNQIEINIWTYRNLLIGAGIPLFAKKIRNTLMETKPLHQTDIDKCGLIICNAMLRDFSILKEYHKECTTNVQIWNCLLYMCSRAAFAHEALDIIKRMKQIGLKCDKSSYINAITACSHRILPDAAEMLYQDALKNNTLSEDMIVCMVDVHARSNNLARAEKYARLVKKAKIIAWTTFLAGCKKYSDYNTMKRIQMEFPFLSNDSSTMVLMANICAVTGNFAERNEIISLMDERNLKKIPGVSYTVLKDGTYVKYTVEDSSAPDEATQIIDGIYAQIKEKYGYVPDISCVLREFPTNEEAITHLHRHSEKIVLGRALMEPGNHPIEISKNLRMCLDCHSFTTKASNLFPDRLISIDDYARIHEFKNGKCSCGGDY
ncbi:hypothetical protein AKO1_013557 [Acrasis kona]|uniref:Pentatricopeptide repeat-containing protein n=1 Tax=Acrasis kona TaxID=1008807 RepID=A0AAW2ZJT6_9EUKA